LKEKNFPFKWFDLNAADKSDEIEDVQFLDSSFKTIMTVWPDNERLQQEIIVFLQSKNLFFGKNTWLF